MGKFSSIYSMSFLLLLASCTSIETVRGPAATLECKTNGVGCPFLNIAHRGAAYEEAENTIPAFEAAMREGANGLEIDLVITTEHEVAVYHDRDPNAFIAFLRQAGLEKQKYIPHNPKIFSGERVPVEELTLDELRRIYGYALRSNLFKDIIIGSKKDPEAIIPTVDEFAIWADKQENLEAVFLDIKLVPGQEELVPVMAKKIASVFAKSAYRIYMLTQYESIYIAFQHWINDNPKAPNRYLTLDMEKGGALRKRATLRDKLHRPVRSLALGSTILRSWEKYLVELEDVLNQSRRRKDIVYPVVSWTVDDERKLYRLLQMGVDGILTNRPGRLNRLLNRHWKDHSVAAKTLASCYDRSKKEGAGIVCATGPQLAPLAPIGDKEIRKWVCSEKKVHATLRDFYGCNGLFDKVNIRFATKIEDDPAILMVTSPGGVHVGKSSTVPTANDEFLYFEYTQKLCRDGVLNAKCEYRMDLEVESQWSWKKIGARGPFKDSFGAYFIVPKGKERLRLTLSETDDGKVDDSAMAIFDRDSVKTLGMAGKKKRFGGDIRMKRTDMAYLQVNQGNMMPLALEYTQKSCYDGILNARCEYKLEVEVMDPNGKLVKLVGHEEAMKDSFVVYAHVPKDIEGLKITVKEMDGSKVSAQTQFVLRPQHGTSMKIDPGDKTFAGEFIVKHIDYDEARESSEGEKDAELHSQKYRELRNLRELRMP